SFSFLLCPPPTSTLFPYTTLFRSRHERGLRAVVPLRRTDGRDRHVRKRSANLGHDLRRQPPDGGARHGGRHQRHRRLVPRAVRRDRKSTRLNSSHVEISYAVFCLK